MFVIEFLRSLLGSSNPPPPPPQIPRPLLDYDEDLVFWKPEDWYPALCPPEIPKKELLRDVDFTRVDEEARETEDSLKESFDLLINHLTRNADTDLHKLRSIFVWMGDQEVGCREEKSECKNKQSPTYYLQKACIDDTFINKMFAKMCRAAKIPCILVNGQAKGASYDPGDEDIRGECTWAVVYVAGSWRFVFPHWAFVSVIYYQKGKWMLVEDSGEASRQRFTANYGCQLSDFDEFFWLTDPDMMQYICYTPTKEYQLLPEPQTKEKFLALPCFNHYYFSSGWSLIDPLTCEIKTERGWCFINFCSPTASSKLKYELFFNENRSRTSFPKDLQIDHYVTILKRTNQSKSIMARLPVIGTYKLEVNGGLVKFRIVCEHVPSDIRPLPPCSENGHGFTEEAAKNGLSQPSHTQGVVPVKRGEEIDLSFTVQEDIDIMATLVHHTGKRKNQDVQKEKERVTVNVRLPEDDPKPEYAIMIDIIKNRLADESSKQKFTNILSYLLTSDETLNAAIVDKDKQELLQCYEELYDWVAKDDERLVEQAAFHVEMADIKDPILNRKIREKKAKFSRMRQEVLAAARDRNVDRLNLALRHCMDSNLDYRGDVEDGKKVLLALCKEDVKQALKNLQANELHKSLDKAANSCISEWVREQAWFQKGQEAYRRLERLQRQRQDLQSLKDEERANMIKPPDYVIDVLFATYILLGESEKELDTWQNIWKKLKQTGEDELFTKAISFDDTNLRRRRVDLAEDKLKKLKLGDEGVITRLHLWCLERIATFRLSQEITIN
ncbi:uncharacterized protein LOC112575895 [Pomacea canaliculata]|uniref:uncharacterized protein LOC112575895 n=1 Tax=Pomacea canaliculata TaxID=400727 RepID=UPI000D7348C7|nr:uncharacterized protein LOC112575895 [Pomacea canaliculata]